MITLYKAAYQTKILVSEFCGLSTDEKPLVYGENGASIENGSIFHEIDSGDIYKFDAENQLWIKQ